MFRITAIELLLFLVPFLAFFGWLALVRGLKSSQAIRDAMPVAQLTLAGLVLMLVGLGAFATFKRADPDAKYVPAKIENGVLKPAHFE